MCRKHLVRLLLLQLVFVLGGCGGGGDSTPPSQLSVRSVEVIPRGTIEPKSVAAASLTLSSDTDFVDKFLRVPGVYDATLVAQQGDLLS